MTTALAYTKAQSAEVAGVSVATIDRAIRSGRLRAKRSSVTEDGEPTGRYLIFPSELQAWLEGLEDA